MFGSGLSKHSYDRIFKEWKELAFADELMEKICHPEL